MSTADRFAAAKRFVDVERVAMAYHEVGPTDPAASAPTGGAPSALVFLHGNPTSSYLWRGVLAHVSDRHRCVAPDLVGMGDSAKLADPGPDRYSFAEHRHYLDGLLAALDLGERVVLVLHDWGSALGFDWARRHAERVAGIAYMEGFVRPLVIDEWPAAGRQRWLSMRGRDGEHLVLDENAMIEIMLARALLEPPAPGTLAEYRRPFPRRADRWPLLRWPREVPMDGAPADVVAAVDAYSRWLRSRPGLPKLFVNAEPGALLVGAQRELARTFPDQTEVTVRAGHFVPEDAPDAVGRALRDWLEGLVGPAPA
ncbi:MAG: haloalkane dehalogenase [Acidimicrobiia bacterium]|nr:haloalkane dehalogenase [Acidimicrobiia bacterium]